MFITKKINFLAFKISMNNFTNKYQIAFNFI